MKLLDVIFSQLCLYLSQIPIWNKAYNKKIFVDYFWRRFCVRLGTRPYPTHFSRLQNPILDCTVCFTLAKLIRTDHFNTGNVCLWLINDVKLNLFSQVWWNIPKNSWGLEVDSRTQIVWLRHSKFLPVEHRSWNRSWNLPEFPPTPHPRNTSGSFSSSLFYLGNGKKLPGDSLTPKTWEKSPNNIEIRPDFTYLKNFFCSHSGSPSLIDTFRHSQQFNCLQLWHQRDFEPLLHPPK